MGEMTNILEKYIEYTVRLVVENPDDVKVQISLSTKTVIVQIFANKNDIGKVIGRKGRIIEALKVLCLSIKNTKYSEDTRKILLEVIEDEDSSFSFN